MNHSKSNERITLKIESFGIYQAELLNTSADHNAASGYRNDLGKTFLIERTRRIPILKGLTFGITVIASGGLAGRLGQFRQVWHFPKPGLRNPDTGRTYLCEELPRELRFGESSILTYTFDSDFEMLSGQWRVEIWHDDNKLSETSFSMAAVTYLTPIRKLKEWLQQRRDNHVKHFAEDYIDIVTLHRKGIVRARGTGQSITGIDAEIQSRVRVPVKVAVAHGTYFKSTGNHQNMVTRREHRFVLQPMDTQSVHVPASCINASLPIPSSSDGFHGVARVSNNLTRFLQAAESEDPMTVQAGVWAITDGYTGSQVQSHLRVRRVDRNDPFGLRGLRDYTPTTSAVSDYNIQRAREILANLKIRTNL